MRKIFYWKIIVFAFCFFLLGNCKVPYDPPLKNGQTNFLVVEGFIDGAAPTVIKLSRTRMVSNNDTATQIPELFATVLVEDDQNNSYSLGASGDGTYTSFNTLNLNPANKYRVRIQTAGGKEYVSDFVPYKASPGIDELGWKLKDGGLQVFVNTHDPNDATKYYRWEYKETWEFHSAFATNLEYLPNTDEIVPRTDQVHICWQSNNFSTILIGSSAKLQHDVIEQAPLLYIPAHNQKTSVLYSILVKQYALDLDGYNYWEAMRNNTEKIGSIFDPQPNQTIGNIHSVSDAEELVVGYIGAGSTVETRYFIKNSEMPQGWNLPSGCETRTVTSDSTAFYFGNGYDPTSESMLPTGDVIYEGAFVECVDCTLAGTNVKPDFWP
jgi:hypothetical protein